MRIAWIVPGFEGGDDQPGIPALSALARTLAERVDLQVVAVRFPQRARYRLGRVPVRSFGRLDEPGARPLRRLRSACRWWRVLAWLTLEHRRSPFDAVHGFWATEPGMLAALAGRLLDVPSLVSLAGGEFAAARSVGYGGRLRPLERAQVAIALNLAGAIGVPSSDARSRVLARYPWLGPELWPLPLGFDPDLFRPAGSAAAREPRIVCVASWSPVKGHDLLLDAFRLLLDSGAPPAPRLVLVGERTDSAVARAAVARRGLTGRVEARGALPQAALPALLAGATVAVITSWHEAQCLAVVEALACGVPVVSTRVGIARELLADPRLGEIVPVRSPARVAEALERQLGYGVEVSDAARSIRADAVAHLALPAVAERFLQLYRALGRI